MACASTLVDTAGLRATSDIVEAEGVARSKQAHAVADLTLLVLDRSRPLDADDRDAISHTADKNRLIVANKADLAPAWREGEVADAISVSATTGAGLDELRAPNCGGARRRSARRSPGDHERASHRSRAARARRADARARPPRWRTAERCRRNSCSPIFRTRAPRSRRSAGSGRPMICWRTSFRDSVSASDQYVATDTKARSDLDVEFCVYAAMP